MSLKEMLDISEKFEPYVADYKIKVFNVAYLPVEVRKQFTSDFKIIADFFAEKNNPDYVPSKERITHVEAVLHLLKVFTNDFRYDRISADIMEKQSNGEVITMCDFAERMWNSGEAAGIEKGIAQGMEKGRTAGKILAYFDMGLSIEEVSDKVNLTVEQVSDILEQSLVSV